MIARYQDNPGKTHWEAVKQILKYVKGTKHVRLKLGGIEGLKPNVFCDAAFGNCIDTRRSTTGLVIRIGNSVIGWRSTKQQIVTVSSTEAE